MLSQLLEILLDINESRKIPIHLRHDLRSPPPSESEVPDLEPDTTPTTLEQVQQARAALVEARNELEAGQLDEASFKETEAELTAIIIKGRSLVNLSKTNHTTAANIENEPPVFDLKSDAPSTYLTIAHEEEWLTALDNYLDLPHTEDNPVPTKARPTERDREKANQIENPMSVFNWLSKHKPKELIEEDEKQSKVNKKSSPKPPTSAPAASRAGTKREKVVKAEEEVLDEDGLVVGGVAESGQKKRRRGADDDAYRPKGGGKKRKRASTKSSVPGTGTDEV